MSARGAAIDFAKTANDYCRHRVGFPDTFFNRMVHFGVGLPGQKVIDMGTGSGNVARGLAMRGAKVVGIDPCIELIHQARRYDQEVGVQVHYIPGTAENSGLPDDVCEVFIAGQCWHWFDRPKAASEARRLVASGGHMVIAHFDWLPFEGTVAEATEALILEHNPDWQLAGGCGIYPEWLMDVTRAGFVAIETFSFDEPIVYTPDDWRGRIRASAGVGASLTKAQVEAFDRAHLDMLDTEFPGAELSIPHRVWAVVCKAP